MTRRESPPTEPVYRGPVWSPLKPWGPIEKRKDQQPPVIDPLDTPESVARPLGQSKPHGRSSGPDRGACGHRSRQSGSAGAAARWVARTSACRPAIASKLNFGRLGPGCPVKSYGTATPPSLAIVPITTIAASSMLQSIR